jgi:hypothetical protein
MLKKYYYKIIIFILLFVACDWVLSFLLSQGLSRVQSDKMNMSSAMVSKALRNKPQVVILGNSRAKNNYDPDILGKKLEKSVLNLGCEGMVLMYDRAVMDIVLQQYNPELFIVNIEALSIVGTRIFHLSRIEALTPFIDKSPVLRKMIYDFSPFERLKYLVQSYRYNGKAFSILYNNIVKDKSGMGFKPLQGIFKKGTPQRAYVKDPTGIHEYMVGILRAMIRQAKESGVKIVFVNAPFWRSDFKINPAFIQRRDYLERLLREENVPYLSINLENTPQFHDPTLFKDYIHLNEHGARIFSDMLAQWILENNI